MQRARHRAGRGHQSDFSRALGSVAAHFVGHFDQDHVDLRRVLGLQNAAIAQQQRIRRGVGAGEVFRERVAQSHVDSAFHLSGAAFGIDGAANVVRRHHTLNAAIVVQDHHLRGVAEGHVRGRIGERFRSARLGGEVANVVARILAADQLFERRMLQIVGELDCRPLCRGATERGGARRPCLAAFGAQLLVPADCP